MQPDNSTGKTQIKRVFEAFELRPATMLTIARLTGIERASICRYVANMRENNSIFLIRQGLCPISGHRAGFYTTDERYFNIDPTLF